MQPSNINRFRSAIIAIVAVAVIAAAVILALRYAAPEAVPMDENTSETSESVDSENQQMPNSPSGQINDGSQGATAPISEETTIAISNFAYEPALITVKRGTTITWTNQDKAEHTVTAVDDNGPDSELLSEGESYSYTFNEIGEFNYFCKPHPTSMKAVVQVVE